MSKRAAGILLPITSLPSKYGIGCFSKAAYDFVDWLKDAGQTFWQILPICPTSNLNTCIFPRIEDYPLRKLMEAGVAVTVNTDNMTVSGVTLESEMTKLDNVFHLTDEECKTIAANAARASFASEEDKKWLLAQIEAL